MRLIIIISLFFFSSSKLPATIYTFHTAGDYNEVSNWDMYPGNNLNTNDTISIEANCWNINLDASQGYVVFLENINQIGINWVTISSSNCQLEFLSSYFTISINGGGHFRRQW